MKALGFFLQAIAIIMLCTATAVTVVTFGVVNSAILAGWLGGAWLVFCFGVELGVE